MLFLIAKKRRFDLPSLVVERDQAGGGVTVVVEQGRGEPVDAGVPAGGGGDGDLAFDDAHVEAADPGQERAVAEMPQDRWFTGRGQPGQQRRAGGGDLFEQGVAGQALVEQHDHAGVQGPGQPGGVGALTGAGRPEHDVDDRAGAAGDQSDQRDLRVAAGLGVLVAAFAQTGAGGGVVGRV
jgi:hypothetical protein